MRTIHYAGGEFIVSDKIAAAIMDYAMALAQGTEADLITIPTYDKRGVSVQSQLLIGPASQILSSPLPGAEPESTDDELLADLGRRAAALRPARPEPEAAHDIDLDLEIGR
ncbi:hypothetical protein MN032_17425 [Agromyces atrinae]|uniref:hypothetical protein n=1 Tax=Agromyces atrinae TaxID=592376 RepID=UPI001F589E1B|nr:hypothetical protein [Agromyces atrinae]MCI2959468.1 hypothetical protein [Agromyces atrinae]